MRLSSFIGTAWFSFLAFFTFNCTGPELGWPQVGQAASPRLALRCDDVTTVPLGTPISVRVEVLNLTARPVSMLATDCDTTFVLDLFRGDEKVPFTSLGDYYQNQAKFLNCMGDTNAGLFDPCEVADNIPPFGTAEHQIEVSRLFQIDEPGEYTLVVRRNISRGHPSVIGAQTKIVVLRRK